MHFIFMCMWWDARRTIFKKKKVDTQIRESPLLFNSFIFLSNEQRSLGCLSKINKKKEQFVIVEWKPFVSRVFVLIELVKSSTFSLLIEKWLKRGDDTWNKFLFSYLWVHTEIIFSNQYTILYLIDGFSFQGFSFNSLMVLIIDNFLGLIHAWTSVCVCMSNCSCIYFYVIAISLNRLTLDYGTNVVNDLSDCSFKFNFIY